ncbi:expression site-associated gene 2 (ESAG2) protein, putative [Trypanosoma brucei gambiense DAL972]|uniref:Expression site-associated gene 2 (ESAG2) protein, putative n=1 Tax=Trypanosoma brucei gambiense (strain MHOM/CI/86/DAL972) TaxID=679716 RepID=C9ZIE2_TRYB9|nr:expression site-associated gene 2 (ESAG2) protein, putative [Trypanosoma brucei gambiense DAL972]CBH08934.1 expression site-associated gene 2 (ESAG2) protein, putative [Trypanosoma brucei gambiense DAL972]|eukprot:XP_011771375.1 expression site-associated gene 2 (ESAG2) protein, putative [Trypanosoma brucei gambiense DAL972]
MRRETVFASALLAAVLSPSSQGDMWSFKWTPELIDWRAIRDNVRQEEKHHNVGEFETLCKIYRITQAEAPQPSFKNREKEGEILKNLEEMVSEAEAVGGNKGSSNSSNSTTAYQEMKKLFEKAKKLKEQIEVNRTKALNASRSAKDNMLRAVYGDAVDVARNENKTLEEAMRGNKSLLFNSVYNAATSCGSFGDKLVGKTLINDFFCLCVGEAIDIVKKEERRNNRDSDVEDSSDDNIYYGYNCPCKDEIRRPKNGSWTMMADSCQGDNNKCDPKNIKYNHTEAWDVISKACAYKNVASNVKALKSALAQFDALLNLGQNGYQVRGIFGYVKTDHNDNHTCLGYTAGFTCVSYNHTLENGGIPWYNRLTNATEQLQEMTKYAKESDSHLHELEEFQHEAEEIFLEVKLGGDAGLWKSNRGKDAGEGDDTEVNNDCFYYIDVKTGVVMLLILSLFCMF